MGKEGNVSYVRGLKGVRAQFPLGFSPIRGSESPSAYAVIFGSGVSESKPEVSSLEGAHFFDHYLKTTNTGALEVYGDYMHLQSAGIGTGYVYTKGAMAKSVAGGYVAELGACYYKTQLSAGVVTGQCYVGFFEYVVDVGVANMPSGGVLQLVDIVNGSLNAVHGYLCLRTYGSVPFSNFLNIMDHSVGNQVANVLFSSVKTAATNWTHGLKIRVGSTAYWIMCTSTTPAA